VPAIGGAYAIPSHLDPMSWQYSTPQIASPYATDAEVTSACAICDGDNLVRNVEDGKLTGSSHNVLEADAYLIQRTTT